ncbi:MarR family transcriptional regulator [Nocardiopsis sp. RSe5-2]|uniref:MarR family transcriptional regulator n=1 Tax=Nocardiopsis endophytica TaxID=3018445 RepID=A0ABT4U6S5_9ACTN|nr:MarR family transcriptional regulator [Nocardiopsis endophytica]MDA2812651.1 MarR family transcriptional regulator [Nocardiopsis endophytica]
MPPTESAAVPPAPADPAAAPPSFTYVAGRVDQGIRRELNRRLRPHGLSVPELTVLSVLARRTGLSNAQLARRSMVTPQSMNQVLASLEQRSLVERTSDPDHGRVRRTVLTPEGAAVLGRAQEAVDELEDEILGDLSPAQRALVLESLVHCMERLSELSRDR